MNSIITISAVFCAVAVATSTSSANADISQVRIAVDGLGCPFCVYGIEKKLKQIQGVESVSIDLKSGLAVANLKSSKEPNLRKFPEAVKKAGFTPREPKIVVIGTVRIRDGSVILMSRQSRTEYSLSTGANSKVGAARKFQEQLAAFGKSGAPVAILGSPSWLGKSGKPTELVVHKVARVAVMRFSVDGLECEKCAARLTLLIHEMIDVVSVTVNRTEGIIKIESLEGCLKSATVISIVGDAGFNAKRIAPAKDGGVR